MVEAVTQINHTINAKVTATSTDGLISSVTNGMLSEGSNDFNLIAANCNTNVCFFCQKSFTNVYNCRRHIRTHSGEKPFQCNICGKKFSRQSTLNTHEKIHTGDQLFKCDVCGRHFDVYRHLTEHMAVHRIDKPFTCKICNKSYSRATVLSQHMKIHSETLVHKCKVCGKGFMSALYLKHHESTHANENRTVAGNGASGDIEEEEEPTSESQYECRVCGKTYNNEREYTNHIQVHNSIEDSEPYSEEMDEQPDRNDPDIGEGIDEGDENEFADELDETEVRKVINTERNCCELCGKELKDEADAILHKKNHNCEKYKCEICDKRFSILSNFNVHKRIHKRDKPFRCDVCGKSFRLHKSLTVHMVLHSESDSFNCEICDRSFGRSGSLKIHMKSHVGEQQSQQTSHGLDMICNDDIIDGMEEEENNRELILEIIEDNPTFCDICGKKFLRSNKNMRTHKCSKYSTSDDFDMDDNDDQSSAIDIWNCD